MIKNPPKTEFSYQAALYFLEQGHYLFCDQNGKKKTSKFIAASDIAAAFAGQEQDSGWFPAGVLRCGHNTGGAWFVYSAPPQKVEITLEGDPLPGSLPEGKITIPIPRTVLVGAHKQYRIWALKGSRFEHSTNAYHAPFPNVHANGEICWGLNEPPKVHPGAARQAWELFFRLPFNRDLANGKSSRYPSDVRRLLAELDGKRTFPCEELVEMHKTIRHLVEETIGGRER